MVWTTHPLSHVLVLADRAAMQRTGSYYDQAAGFDEASPCRTMLPTFAYRCPGSARRRPTIYLSTESGEENGYPPCHSPDVRIPVTQEESIEYIDLDDEDRMSLVQLDVDSVLDAVNDAPEPGIDYFSISSANYANVDEERIVLGPNREACLAGHENSSTTL